MQNCNVRTYIGQMLLTTNDNNQHDKSAVAVVRGYLSGLVLVGFS